MKSKSNPNPSKNCKSTGFISKSMFISAMLVDWCSAAEIIG